MTLWGICREAQRWFGTIAKSSPDVYQTITSLDPISLAPLLEALTRYVTYPKAAIYRVKLESGLVTEDDMLPIGAIVSFGLLQAETLVVGSQQAFCCGSIGTATMGKESVVDGFPAIPHYIQIPHPCHQGQCTNEAILSHHPQQRKIIYLIHWAPLRLMLSR